MSELPLTGHSVLVTRPALQNEPLCSLLRTAGATPLALPLIEIVPDAPALAQLSAQAAAADWLIFVSPSAVDIGWPVISQSNARLACVGRPSAVRLEQYARQPVIYPTTGNDSRALLKTLQTLIQPGQRILIVRGSDGRDELAAGLRQYGTQVSFADIYQRREINADWSAFDTATANGSLSAACVTSSQIATLLFSQAGSHRRATLQSLPYCVPHERIAARLTEYGAQDIMIIRDGDQAMVAALCQRL